MAKYTDNSEFPKEALITKRVADYLKELAYWKGWKASDRFHPGVSDYVGCYYGAFVGIELKAEGGTATQHQGMFIAEVVACGGYGMVCSTMGQVKNFLAYVKADTMKRMCVDNEGDLLKFLTVK